MNFLSHFYNELPCDDAYFACGVLLPDILSNYSSRKGEVVKVHPDKLIDNNNVQFASLNSGIQKHYIADAFFHESGFFHENTKTIEEIISKYDFSCFVKRIYAFSHVMLEIMLDRKLLTENKKTCDDLYNLLDILDMTIITDFIAFNTKAGNPADVAGHMNRFRKVRFIYDYTNDPVVIQILNRINQRLGNPVFNATDIHNITSVIHDFEKRLLSQKFPKFLPKS
ncbi:MAG: hypothetical protein H7Y00_00280 [Fimbriimonadaceae bacterium]|nr:hypothetical protein [Chitinophagales bacterium]